MLIVSLMQTSDTAAVAAGLRRITAGARRGVRGWNELVDVYDKTAELYDRQFGVLRQIILVMMLLSVGNNVNMSLFERAGEFGAMSAVGGSGPQDLLALVVTEGALLGLLGTTLGVVIGVALAFGISAVGIQMPPPPNSNLG